MKIVLGSNQYGKAETRLVRITRQGDVHSIKDVNVSVALSGDFEAVHLTGDNSKVLPTDTQKNTVYAFAKQAPVGEIEEFGLRLARHFVDGYEPVMRARVTIEEYPWSRIAVNGSGHPHSFTRAGAEKRLSTVTYDGKRALVVSGLSDLVVLKSTGSEFWGYMHDRYTTLEETRDRILATAVTARWLYSSTEIEWSPAFANAREKLIETFATTHSLSLQQTLYKMGEAVLEARPEVAEVRMAMPNKHHFLVDLSPFGLQNDDEVYYAADRPYGLIEGGVLREGAEPAPEAW